MFGKNAFQFDLNMNLYHIIISTHRKQERLSRIHKGSQMFLPLCCFVSTSVVAFILLNHYSGFPTGCECWSSLPPSSPGMQVYVRCQNVASGIVDEGMNEKMNAYLKFPTSRKGVKIYLVKCNRKKIPSALPFKVHIPPTTPILLQFIWQTDICPFDRRDSRSILSCLG